MLKLIKRFDANHVKISFLEGNLDVSFLKDDVDLSEFVIHDTPTVTTSFDSLTMSESWVLDFNSNWHQFELIRS